VSSWQRKELKIEDFRLRIEDLQNTSLLFYRLVVWKINLKSQIFNLQSQILFKRIQHPGSGFLSFSGDRSACRLPGYDETRVLLLKAGCL
jgi:hypothetical protein